MTTKDEPLMVDDPISIYIDDDGDQHIVINESFKGTIFSFDPLFEGKS